MSHQEEKKNVREFKVPSFGESVPLPEPSLKIFICGATGNVGSAAIQNLLSKYPEVHLTAGVRSVDRGREILPPNVKLVVTKELPGNRDSVIALTNGMSGCDAVLIVPPCDDRVDVGKIYVEAAEAAKVKFICLISVACAQGDNCNKSLVGSQFAKIETAILATGIKHSFLRCEFFMDDLLWSAPSIKKKQEFSLSLFPDVWCNPVAVSDVGAMAAEVLMLSTKSKQILPIGPLAPHKLQESYHLTAPEMFTMTDVAEILGSKITKKEVKYVQGSRKQVKDLLLGLGVSLMEVEGTLELFELANQGYNKVVSQDLELLLKRKPLTVGEFLEAHKRLFV